MILFSEGWHSELLCGLAQIIKATLCKSCSLLIWFTISSGLPSDNCHNGPYHCPCEILWLWNYLASDGC